MALDEGRVYEQSCDLCASITIYLEDAPFSYFKAWLQEVTAGVGALSFAAETAEGKAYSLRLFPAIEVGDEWEGRATRGVPVDRDLLARLQKDRSIQEFYMDGSRTDTILPFRAIYIKVVRLKNGRVDVSVYSCDAAVKDYANQLVQNMKNTWGKDATAGQPPTMSISTPTHDEEELGGGPGGTMRYSIEQQDKMVEGWFRVKMKGSTPQWEYIGQYNGLLLPTFKSYITKYKRRHKKQNTNE
jgi:hypothetical protein